jgi:hypothetical protein
MHFHAAQLIINTVGVLYGAGTHHAVPERHDGRRYGVGLEGGGTEQSTECEEMHVAR